MKKCILILTAVCLAVFLTACETVPTRNTSSSGATKAPTPVETIAPTEAPKSGEGTIGDYFVKIVSAKKAKDIQGKDALIVTYEWKNNSETDQMFSTALTTDVFQNGAACQLAVVTDVDAMKSLTKIKPGVTQEVQQAYVLTDGTDATVEVSLLISFTDKTKVTKVFSLG